MFIRRSFLALAGLGVSLSALANDQLLDEVLEQHARIAHAVYEDSLEGARTLQLSLQALVDAPTDAKLQAARDAWLAAREPYGQSEVLRFRMGPIDSLDGVNENGPEGRINGWPLGEALIDYVAPAVDGDAGPESPDSVREISGNVIADRKRFPEINAEFIAGLHELGEDERNVASGYHAIEFLLWGQDLNADGGASPKRDSSAGQRPVSDYARSDACTSGAGNKQPAWVCQRRGEYLLAAAELLVDDLAEVTTAWAPNADNHRARFVAGGGESMAKILEAMGRLSFGELAGERINVALLTDSQEDEHSCFSDNTHRDILLNAQGIQNVFLGEYHRSSGQRLSGPGVRDFIATKHADLADKLGADLEATAQRAEKIDAVAKAGKPFDQQINFNGGNPDILGMIRALVAQTRTLEDVIHRLGLSTGDLRQDTEQKI